MGDDKDLERLISGHGDAPQSIPVHPPGNVDVTARLGDVVVRVATSGDRIKLTLSGQDGMVTATFGPNDSRILENLLSSAGDDARQLRRGSAW